MKNVFSSIAVLFLLFESYGYSQGIWTQQTLPVTSDITSIYAVDNNTCWACGYYGTLGIATVLRTTNGGANWTLNNGGLPGNKDFFSIFAFNQSICWIGTDEGTIFRTTNGGVNWTQVSLPLPVTTYINGIYFFNSQYGFVLGDPNPTGDWRYYITTNGGTNWAFFPTIPSGGVGETGWHNSFCAIDTAHIWFGTNNTKIYRGSFRGAYNWSSIPGTQNIFGVSFFNQATGLAIDQNGLMKSTNGGVNWFNNFFNPAGGGSGIKVFNVNNEIGFICTNNPVSSNGKIYRTTNGGSNWNEQLTNLAIGKSFTCISMTSVNNGWAGTGGTTLDVRDRKTKIANRNILTNGGVYKYTDNVISINKNNSEIPKNFILEQNYPNPFNSSTKIKFQIPADSPARTGKKVILIIYDITGREVYSIINKSLQPGTYEIYFDASNLSGGVYFYKLSADENSQTRVMVFSK
jgi:photosystem II stability/assembly factor-like uncharacterized protein